MIGGLIGRRRRRRTGFPVARMALREGMVEMLLCPVLLGLLGAVIGSFLATLVIRWPQGRSVLRGRSHCDGCDAALSARDLVPLASSALARGRCRRCGAAIDSRHWQIELGCLGIGVLAGVAVPGPPPPSRSGRASRSRSRDRRHSRVPANPVWGSRRSAGRRPMRAAARARPGPPAVRPRAAPARAREALSWRRA